MTNTNPALTIDSIAAALIAPLFANRDDARATLNTFPAPSFAELIIDDCRDDDDLIDTLALDDDARMTAFLDALDRDYARLTDMLIAALNRL